MYTFENGVYECKVDSCAYPYRSAKIRRADGVRWECLEGSLIDSNTNCDIYTPSGSSYICDGCPSTAPHLVTLALDADQNAVAKGCAQILIPNAIIYKKT